MWHYLMNISHVIRDHSSTTASQPWKALLFGSNRMCKHFLWIFPWRLLPLSCSFFAILAAPHSSISPSIASFGSPTWSCHMARTRSEFVLTHEVPSKQLRMRLQAHVQGRQCACQTGTDLNSGPGACDYSLARTLRRKRNHEYADSCTPGEDASAAGDSVTWLAPMDARADYCIAGANASSAGDSIIWQATALICGIVNVFKKMERGEEFKKFNRL
jgi:hypothetical protein